MKLELDSENKMKQKRLKPTSKEYDCIVRLLRLVMHCSYIGIINVYNDELLTIVAPVSDNPLPFSSLYTKGPILHIQQGGKFRAS